MDFSYYPKCLWPRENPQRRKERKGPPQAQYKRHHDPILTAQQGSFEGDRTGGDYPHLREESVASAARIRPVTAGCAHLCTSNGSLPRRKRYVVEHLTSCYSSEFGLQLTWLCIQPQTSEVYFVFRDRYEWSARCIDTTAMRTRRTLIYRQRSAAAVFPPTSTTRFKTSRQLSRSSYPPCPAGYLDPSRFLTSSSPSIPRSEATRSTDTPPGPG